MKRRTGIAYLVGAVFHLPAGYHRKQALYSFYAHLLFIDHASHATDAFKIVLGISAVFAVAPEWYNKPFPFIET